MINLCRCWQSSPKLGTGSLTALQTYPMEVFTSQQQSLLPPYTARAAPAAGNLTLLWRPRHFLKTRWTSPSISEAVTGWRALICSSVTSNKHTHMLHYLLCSRKYRPALECRSASSSTSRSVPWAEPTNILWFRQASPSLASRAHWRTVLFFATSSNKHSLLFISSLCSEVSGFLQVPFVLSADHEIDALFCRARSVSQARCVFHSQSRSCATSAPWSHLQQHALQR